MKAHAIHKQAKYRHIVLSQYRGVCYLLFLSLISVVSGCVQQTEKLSDTPIWPTYTEGEAQTFIKQCEQNYLRTVTLFDTLKTTDYPQQQALLTDLNQLDIIMNKTLGRSGLYANVHPNKDVRDAGDVCQQKFVGLISDINLSQALFHRLNSIDIQTLEHSEDKRYITNSLKQFKRSGVNLSPSKRQQVKALNDHINELGQAFYKNMREDVRSLVLPESTDLSGLPEDFIAARKDERGNVTITTDYPDYFPVMQYAHNDDLRKELYIIFRQRGYPANKTVLHNLLEKRYELAQLLGYQDYADYITEELMIKSADNADSFINDIDTIAQQPAEAEYASLLKQLQKIEPNAKVVGDWQKTYLSERIKKEKYDVDSQQVRQYFQYTKVKQGIFDLVQTLFDIEIRDWQTSVWHPSVSSHEIVSDGQVIGRFYLDMHPREDKYKHAAAFGVQGGVKDIQLPISALVCNFPEGDKLMEHAQVETFLHEFGHLLHGMFGGANRWVAHSGTSTERDFVEAPSQMLEEWVWSPETLALFATNKQGEPIPPALIGKMQQGRDFGQGLFTRHQMFYAALSLEYYNNNPADIDLQDTMVSAQNRYSNFPYVNDTYFQYSFGHLHGYSAVYYSYMWSLVIADDMFSEFEKNGMLDKATAARYRKAVLEPGSSRDANELVEDFLGRPYTFDAFAKKFKRVTH